jgi:hypothetical protein
MNTETPLQRATTAHATAQQSAQSAQRTYREIVACALVAPVAVAVAVVLSVSTLPLALVAFHALIGGVCLALVMRELHTARTSAIIAEARAYTALGDFVEIATGKNNARPLMDSPSKRVARYLARTARA